MTVRGAESNKVFDKSARQAQSSAHSMSRLDFDLLFVCTVCVCVCYVCLNTVVIGEGRKGRDTAKKRNR